MSAVFYINPALGSCLIIILIFIDYISKFNTDDFQRKLFLLILVAEFMTVFLDFTSRMAAGRPGDTITGLLYSINTLFLIFQNITHYLLMVFIDYFIHSNLGRAKKGIALVTAFLSVYVITVIINVPFHFYFYMSPDNQYIPGTYYFIRILVSYFPIVGILIDSLVSLKWFKRSQVYMLSFFAILSGAGATLDILLMVGSLIWPCSVAGFLYIYFFIVQADLKIDSLTGIGNRYAFNEFISKLTRQMTHQAYSIVMMDMDHFKEINDTLGHAEGDNALRDMAAIIKGCIRHADFAARYGGDEFVLAIKVEFDVDQLMNRIQAAIDNQNAQGTRPYKIQISYGYDVFTTKSGQSMEQFLAHIDTLMYQNKAARRRNRGKGT